MAIKIREILKKAVSQIEKTQSQTPLLDAEVLLCHVLKTERLFLYVHPNKTLTNEQIEKFFKLVKKRIEGMPVQYIVNRQEFMGMDFYVEEGILIPRPDTEILVEKVIHWVQERQQKGFFRDVIHIADIGSGSGAIGISLAKYIDNAFVYAVDISTKALQITKKNAQNHGVDQRMKFLQGDLLEPLKDAVSNNQIDILVSNPPYIPSQVIDGLQIEVSKYEPRLALDGGKDGYDYYRRLIQHGHEILRDGGLIAFEIGHDQAQTIQKMMQQSGYYTDITITKDLVGVERVVTGSVSDYRES